MTVATRGKRDGASTTAVHETEAELVQALILRMRNDWPVRAFGTEIRSHGRSRLDIGAVLRRTSGDESTDLIIGIEAKLNDGGRALRQAVLNRYVVDASFIAMPLGRVSIALMQEAAKHGIGVIEVQSRSVSIPLRACVATPDASLRLRVNSQLFNVRGRGRLEITELLANRGET